MAKQLKILVVGAGSMGVNHINGLLTDKENIYVGVYDRLTEKINTLKWKYPHWEGTNLDFLTEDQMDIDGGWDGAIISTTANNRLEVIKMMIDKGISHLLIEKPVEQSLNSFEQILKLVTDNDVNAHVNFTFRAIEQYQDFGKWIMESEQFKGSLYIDVLGGAIGIGANGCHILDILAHYSKAVKYEIKSATISDITIPSGRGDEFKDFGGTADIQFLNDNGEVCADVHLSLNPESTAQATVSILGKNGRLDFDHKLRSCNYSTRDAKSELPVNRVYGDYHTRVSDYKTFDAMTGTREWLKIFKGTEILLPKLSDTKMVHQLIFEWLSHGKDLAPPYPIT